LARVRLQPRLSPKDRLEASGAVRSRVPRWSCDDGALAFNLKSAKGLGFETPAKLARTCPVLEIATLIAAIGFGALAALGLFGPAF
jgi:hypothetical protein